MMTPPLLNEEPFVLPMLALWIVASVANFVFALLAVRKLWTAADELGGWRPPTPAAARNARDTATGGAACHHISADASLKNQVLPQT